MNGGRVFFLHYSNQNKRIVTSMRWFFFPNYNKVAGQQSINSLHASGTHDLFQLNIQYFHTLVYYDFL